jgi:hypothetical protein
MSSLGQGRSLPGAQAVALAPAAVAFTLLVVMVQIRMDEPWADGVLLLVALVAAVPLLALALAAPREARAERTILVVCALVLELIIEGDEIGTPGDGPSLVGWPLVLAVATVAAAAWGLRGGRDQIAATS